MSKRINDLAQELGVKSKAILDCLPEIGVTEKKTHSSSVEDNEAERIRQYFGTTNKAIDHDPKSCIDLSKINSPGDVLRLIRERETVTPTASNRVETVRHESHCFAGEYSRIDPENFASALLESLDSTILSPYCVTPEQAERIADHVADCLGLHQKTTAEQAFAFTYQDIARNVRLEVEIGRTNYHGSVSCWAFSCSAGRVADFFNLEPDHSYRKKPLYFQTDAKFLVQAVLAGEVERRKAIKEKIEAARQANPDRFVGTLKIWFESKGHGFLEYSGPGDVFVHIKDVQPRDRRHLEIGQIFSFKRQLTGKGWKAVDIQRVP